MALVPHADIYVKVQGANRCFIVTWGIPTAENTPSYPQGSDPTVRNPPAPTYFVIGQNDTFDPIQLPHAADRCIQITGTAGGGTIAIQGSNDGTNYVTLTDVGGNALTGLTTGVIKEILENTKWIKPVLTGGGGTTAMAIVMSAKAAF